MKTLAQCMKEAARNAGAPEEWVTRAYAKTVADCPEGATVVETMQLTDEQATELIALLARMIRADFLRRASPDIFPPDPSKN